MSEDAGATPSALALIVVLSAQLMVVLDFSIVNVALQSLQRAAFVVSLAFIPSERALAGSRFATLEPLPGGCRVRAHEG